MDKRDKSILFVGGAWDGRFVNMAECPPRVLVPVTCEGSYMKGLMCIDKQEVDRQTYCRMSTQFQDAKGGMQRVELYTLEGTSSLDAFLDLLSHYGKKTTKTEEAIKRHQTTQYRMYADGDVVHQDEFEERNNSTPYYDDYETVDVPDAVIEHIEESVKA